MRRPLVLLVLLAVHAAAFAAPTARYLVATVDPAPRVVTLRTAEGEVERAVRPFRFVRGYAAELTEDEVGILRNSTGVRWIEPDRPVRQLDGGVGFEARFEGLTPSRLDQTVPWGIDVVRAFAVWGIVRGEGIKVGVIDSGIEATHPDLNANYRGGYDFVENDTTPQDENGHGTHVAGTIAAADNAGGVIGVAPGAEIYALRVLNAQGEGTTSAEIDAVEWAIANGIDIINLSLGAESASDLEKEVLDRAAGAGVLAIAATGNAGTAGVMFPAAYPSVVGVSAVDRALRLAAFSNVGDEVDLAGPGVRIKSTVPQATGLFVDVTTSNGLQLEAMAFDRSSHGAAAGAIVYCGLGQPEEISNEVRGNIALMRRGEIPFAEKAKNAMAAGATAVVIFNNIPGEASGWTFADAQGPFPLTVGISLDDGETLLRTPGVTLAVEATPDDYAFDSGTSMAAPHVAGVAALVWSLDRGATSEQVRQALLTTARDLGGAGFDSFYGNGLVDAETAGKQLAPYRFPSRSLRARRKH